MDDFTHLDESGKARMVDATEKGETRRTARARAVVVMRPDVVEKIKARTVQKGDVLSTARIAGIMAAKQTPQLIPLCHPIEITSAEIGFEFLDDRRLQVESTVRTVSRTGVEMEAMTAVVAAALTVYDMCKALQKDIEITDAWLVEKLGGKSGEWRRSEG